MASKHACTDPKHHVHDARGFVAAMGGTVTATDTPGGGLTMVVELANAP